jgi:hypothetical protein
MRDCGETACDQVRMGTKRLAAGSKNNLEKRRHLVGTVDPLVSKLMGGNYRASYRLYQGIILRLLVFHEKFTM